jgi:hypothetical protein
VKASVTATSKHLYLKKMFPLPPKQMGLGFMVFGFRVWVFGFKV